MATRGYNSYRGRVSTGRIVLIVVLVLILLAPWDIWRCRTIWSTMRRDRSIWSALGTA